MANAQTFSVSNYPYYASHDTPKLLQVLLDAVREELVSRDEARAWLAAVSPQFKEASTAKCCANCPR